jgi:hypothetical protein
MLRTGGALGPSYTRVETTAKARRRGGAPMLWSAAPRRGGMDSMIMARAT